MSANNENHDSPYDFFLKPQQPQHRPIIGRVSNRSFKNQLFVIVGGGIVVVIFIIILSSLFIKGTPGIANLTSLVQQQNEIITLTKPTNDRASQIVTQNLGINVNLSLTTNQQQLISYLRKHGHKLSTKQINQISILPLENQLSAANSTNSYDSVYIQIIQNQLSNYLNNLKTFFGQTSNSTQRQLINTDYIAAQTLADQAHTASQNLPNS